MKKIYLKIKGNISQSKHAFDDLDLLGPLNWHELGWHWTDGRQIPFTDWGVGQPGMDILDNCSCTFIRHPTIGKLDKTDKTGNWYITECAAKSTYVCQVPVTSKRVVFYSYVFEFSAYFFKRKIVLQTYFKTLI